ncbi:hypothetical protein [Zhihengliuella flava]|uniref:Uncharacterized protein n=1 Tax=Zhihengliuella flava TaxID=1285193 RepID=A0A931D8L4_9MICC|nr:hypothetical protein [Zhihengliuella flava]MBG6084027.1 hypothetical protein [Zhihengliuella flava]
MQTLPSGSAAPGAAGKNRTMQDSKITIKASTLALAVVVTVFLVAVVFAANQNDIIGWLVVIISLGWLLLSAFLVFGISRGAKKVQEQVAGVRADFAQQNGGGNTTLVDDGTKVRDMKLDHSFKIVQVQTGVVKEYLDQDGEEARGMVDRALETIEITAHNARSMMKDGQSGPGEPLSGDIVD